MAEVGVRALKQHLSQYLDRAQRGELIRVTDRGQPKALLGHCLAGLEWAPGSPRGWITLGSASGAEAGSRGRVIDALAEDREE